MLGRSDPPESFHDLSFASPLEVSTPQIFKITRQRQSGRKEPPCPLSGSNKVLSGNKRKGNLDPGHKTTPARNRKRTCKPTRKFASPVVESVVCQSNKVSEEVGTRSKLEIDQSDVQNMSDFFSSLLSENDSMGDSIVPPAKSTTSVNIVTASRNKHTNGASSSDTCNSPTQKTEDQPGQLTGVKTDNQLNISRDELALSSWGLPAVVTQKYSQRGITHMFQWQAECLQMGDVLNGGNLVYSAPTSAGKTMVAELLVLKRVIETKKKAIIILPFVSVTREKMFYLQELYQDAGVRVSGFMGHYTPAGGFSNVDVAVCTIEKANGLINRLIEQKALSQLGILVVDELHMIGDPNRGYLLELLLTKVAYVAKKLNTASGSRDVDIQVVGMSATLPNLDVLSRWLNADLYRTDFRPVPLTECVKIGTQVYDQHMAVVKEIDLRFAVKGDDAYVVPLCMETLAGGHSVLIFCPTKNWCETLSETIARQIYTLLANPSMPVVIKGDTAPTDPDLVQLPLDGRALRDTLEQLRRTPTGLDKVLGCTVQYGVAYHHAGLTFDERDIIEGAFRQGILKVLVATSTLSSGVNLPARRVIVRTPIFHGNLIDFLTYKQMIGRAGRKGVDTAGESILVCKENERGLAEQLLQGSLPPVHSTLIRNQELGSSLKRAILEVVVGGVAETPGDVSVYAGCTMLAASLADTDEQMGALIQQCIAFLQENEFISIQNYTDKGECGERFVASKLGLAILASSLSPDEGLTVFMELQKARQCFVLENELHIIYQVTPIYLRIETIDWFQYFSIWESLTPSMKKVAELVGVRESFLTRAIQGRFLTKTSAQVRTLAIHKRFYTALVLHDLVQEMPLNQVCKKYNCNKGQLQSLQQSAATFAGMVTVFCARLGWSNLELILGQFQSRLTFGVQRELCDLVRLTSLNAQRARCLYNAGYQTVSALATANPADIETALKNSVPFQSGKRQESETDWEVAERRKARCVFLTGRRGVTEYEAAVVMVTEAKTIIQQELGGVELQWDRRTAPTANIQSPVLLSPQPGSSKTNRRSRQFTKQQTTPAVAAKISNQTVVSPPAILQPRNKDSDNQPILPAITHKNIDGEQPTGVAKNSQITNKENCSPSNSAEHTSSEVLNVKSKTIGNNCLKLNRTVTKGGTKEKLKLSKGADDTVILSQIVTTKSADVAKQDSTANIVVENEVIQPSESERSALLAESKISYVRQGENNASSANSGDGKDSNEDDIQVHVNDKSLNEKDFQVKTQVDEMVAENDIMEYFDDVDGEFTDSFAIDTQTVNAIQTAESKNDVEVKDKDQNSNIQSVDNVAPVSDSAVKDSSRNEMDLLIAQEFADSLEMSPEQDPVSLNDRLAETLYLSEASDTVESSCNALDRNISPDYVELTGILAASNYDRVSQLGSQQLEVGELESSFEELRIPYQSGQVCSTPDGACLAEFRKHDNVNVKSDSINIHLNGARQTIPKPQTSNVNIYKDAQTGVPAPVQCLNRQQAICDAGMFDIPTQMGESFCSTFTTSPQSNNIDRLSDKALSETTDTDVSVTVTNSKGLTTSKLSMKRPSTLSTQNTSSSEKIPKLQKTTSDHMLPKPSSLKMENKARSAKNSAKQGTNTNKSNCISCQQTVSESKQSLFTENEGISKSKNNSPETPVSSRRSHVTPNGSKHARRLSSDSLNGEGDCVPPTPPGDETGAEGITPRTPLTRHRSSLAFSPQLTRQAVSLGCVNDTSNTAVSKGTKQADLKSLDNVEGNKSNITADMGTEATKHDRLGNKVRENTSEKKSEQTNSNHNKLLITPKHSNSKDQCRSGYKNKASLKCMSNKRKSTEKNKNTKNTFRALNCEPLEAHYDGGDSDNVVDDNVAEDNDDDDNPHCPSFIDPDTTGISLSQQSFTIIDVCSDKRLFKTFIMEWRTKPRYALSLACEKLHVKPPTAGIGANFKKGSVEQCHPAAPEDEGIAVQEMGICITGLAVSWDSRDAYYVAFTHTQPQGDPDDSLAAPPSDRDISVNIRLKAVKSVLQQSRTPAGPTTTLLFDCKANMRALVMGCGFAPGGNVEDPKIACWMLDPGAKERNLHRMVTNWLPTEVHMLQGIGGGIGVSSLGMSPENPGSGRYRATTEAVLVRHLAGYFEACLGKEGIYETFTEVEMPAAVIMARMELTGIGFSSEESERQKCVMLSKLSCLEQEAYSLARHPFSLSAADDVSQVLFHELRLPPNGDVTVAPASLGQDGRGSRRGGIRYSTSKDVLEKLVPLHRLPAVILEWRRITNALTKTVFPLQKNMVHCEWLGMDRVFGECQLHTATGRVSMSEPNIQNVPKDFDIMVTDESLEAKSTHGGYRTRSTQGRRSASADQLATAKFSVSMRHAFVPFEGGVLVAADYSQLELRMIAHLSCDTKLISVLNTDGDVFKLITAQWKNIQPDDVTPQQRAQAKQVCYGMLYGIGPKALGEQLEVEENDAAVFMETFKAKYPGMRTYLRTTVDNCRRCGYVTTLSGRRRYLPHITSTNPHARAQAERQAINTTVQGSAADLVKTAMIHIDQALQEKFPLSQYTHKHKLSARHAARLERPPGGAYLVIQLHDELMYEVPATHALTVARLVKHSMEHALALTVQMPVKVKVGTSWGTLEEVDLD